ncbi:MULTISPECIES: acyl-CoA dehydratase activase [Tissierellales]|jgi:predicted CoA-substrate-specific enzyme activase|uniref:CoA activase n=1 Tax=Acidilutibacter cellobiosedens TaxID=2507161 RepID=A0A410QBT1_9FIRM|nr:MULTISPECIES: acyl-CoA dehydratase activase [Tissierellales]MBE6082980.1 CoA activase [Tissierellaceae bacterium]QAT61512.1 CoA activase [Acidilutibacter cellobiosedens]SCL83633.1 2-hydroxyglutaryl-CoA dehydratase component A [Sporanaerobacter sp. PP17-6a]
MYYIGIDIGSTASKVSVFNQDDLVLNMVMPTGWNSLDTSMKIKKSLDEQSIDVDKSVVVATGYGRVSVPYAKKTVTEITCHGKGAYYLAGEDITVMDIGGQDTKIITVKDGNVTNFLMNDKCAAGTGRFIELMSNTLGVSIEEMGEIALYGKNIKITSMCTVFAESEVINLIGSGTKREDIARGVFNSIIGRIKTLLNKNGMSGALYLTGGLCELKPFVQILSESIGQEIHTNPLARYAGSIGGALLAKKLVI